ncbi:thermonuclease family protein [Planctomicrobium sp. SH661]|uniref:thermonuclease family protein n=1 Tax=Planctomicrobium sp. SH661 TaxID=3448124 RepID=UPI003F5C29BE
MQKAYLVAFTLSIVSLCHAGRVPVVQRVETGKVVGVTDGDTVRILIGTEEVKVRLEGIDAPESKQAFGTKAKQHLSDLIFDKEIELRVTGTDRYGRTIGKIFVGETDVNLQMIRDGMAWHYTQFNAEEAFAVAQAEAKEAGRGLWADPAAVPPWEYRKRK